MAKGKGPYDGGNHLEGATPGAELWLLWLWYWANGGDGQEWELDAFIHACT
jgi:hypothetical protein